MCYVKKRAMCDVKRRAMCDVQVTACLLFLLLFQAVCINATPEGAVRMKRSGDVSTATSQTSGDGSLMTMMQAELTSLRTTVSILEDRLNNLQNASSLTVAFTARISGDRDRNLRGLPLGYQQTVVFNDVLTNVGNAYNSHTGLFTAPVDGTYVFFLTIMGVAKHHDPNSGDIYLDIVKNGAVLDTVMAEGGHYSFHDQGSSLVTTQLRRGDHVWVRQNGGNAVRGGPWTVFTGYLLHA